MKKLIGIGVVLAAAVARVLPPGRTRQGGAQVPHRGRRQGRRDADGHGDRHALGGDDRQGRQRRLRQRRRAARRLQQAGEEGRPPRRARSRFRSRRRSNQSQAALEKAQVDARNSEIGLRRQKALWSQQLAAQADLDQAQANYDSAVAAVARRRRTLTQAQTDLRNSKIVAPIDGVVVDRQYDVGQTVAASFQAPTLFTIAQDLTKMQVSADVSESDIGRCKVGAARPLHRRRVPRPDLPRQDRADPPERDGEPERRDLSR